MQIRNTHIAALAMLLAVQLIANDTASCQDDPIVVGPAELGAASYEQLETARTKLEENRRKFENYRQLVQRGSVSKSRYQQSKYQLQTAELELKALENPENASSYRLEIAKLQLKNAEQRFETNQQMYARGSVSKLDLRRSSYRVKYARIALKVATGEYSSESGKLLIAEQRLKLATTELKLGEKLLQQRAISQSGYQRLVDRAREAKQTKREIEKLFRQHQKAVKSRFGT